MMPDELRYRFIKTLVSRNVLDKEILEKSDSKPLKTICIFDWDDTLFCTTFLRGIKEDPRKLSQLEIDRLKRHGLLDLDECLVNLYNIRLACLNKQLFIQATASSLLIQTSIG